MNSKDYWLQREAEQLKHNITEEAAYDKEIKRIYQNMLDACQKEIESFYAKYAGAEGITIAEAKKRVAQHDVKAFERKAAKYVKDKDFSKKANEELRLYNATMKINRLEMLKANIGLETIAGHDELEKFMEGILKGRTEDELKRQAGILGKTVLNNARKADAIVNGSFHSGTFSDRIWQYQDLMREDLGRLLQQGLIQGKGARAIAKDLKKYWFGADPKTGGGATYCMERLMRTELARVQTEAQKQSFIRNGFDMYQFICNHHASKHGTCDICKGLDGKHFKVADMMPGENAPPMHPHCRCSTAAYEDSADYEAWLDFLANGGTTEEWNELKNGKSKPRATSKASFTPAKTIEEAEEYGKRFVAEKTWSKDGRISYKGLGLDGANAINRTLTELFDRFSLPKFKNVLPMNFRENRWKGSQDTPMAYVNNLDGGLYFNPKIMKSPKAVDAYIKRGNEAYEICKRNIDRFDGSKRELIERYVTAGRSLVADDAQDKMAAMIQHEVGHHIQNQIMLKDKSAVEIVRNGFAQYGGTLSGYATKTQGEYIAESFCAFMNDEADRIDPALRKYFEGLVK